MIGMDFKNIKYVFACLLLTKLLVSVEAKDYLEADSSYLELHDEDGKTSNGDSSFSYNMYAYNGPWNWGNLNPQWRSCGIGKSQSPIDIRTYMTHNLPSLGDLIRTYKPARARVQGKGHSVTVEWTGDAGGIKINGVDYKLQQCHWHVASEHTFNNIRFDAELHIVHKSDQGDQAVVGIVYRFGPSDPFLEWLLPYLRAADSEEIDLGVVNPFWIGLGDREYFRYNGSLTTPPCSENITWTIFKMVRTISQMQVIALRNGIIDGQFGNARPLQLLGGRIVYSFKPTSSL